MTGLQDLSKYLDSGLLSDIDVAILVSSSSSGGGTGSGGTGSGGKGTAHADVEPDTGGAAAGAPRDARKRTRKGEPAAPAVVLPGHRLVLHGASPMFAAQIERWSDGAAGDAGAEADAAARACPRLRAGAADADVSTADQQQRPARPRVDLIVDDAADVEAAQLLFRSMYTGAKALEGASQSSLLSVLRLADRFQVDQSAVAAGQLLQTIPTGQMNWSTVEAVYLLPEGCREAPAFRAALQAAGNKLQQQLGDLDAAMCSAAKRQRLLSLPLAALCALLQDDRTRASCEDTALAVATAWCHHRWGAKGGNEGGAASGEAGERTLQHAATRLAGVVRLGRLSPVVLATVAARTAWVQAAISMRQLLGLAAFTSGGSTHREARIHNCCGVIKSKPQWFYPARPLAAATEAWFLLEVTVEELEAATEAVLAVERADSGGGDVGSGRSRSRTLAQSPAKFFGGFMWRACILVMPCKGQHKVEYCVNLQLIDEGHFDVHEDQCIPCEAECVPIQRQAGAAPRHEQSYDWAYFVGANCSFEDSFGLGPQAGWDPAAWQAKGLVLDGGKVKVRVTIRLR